MKKIKSLVFILLLFVSLISCRKELKPIDNPADPTDPDISLLDLNIPGEFAFETSKEVTVSFNDFKSSKSNPVKYNIYLYSDRTTFEEISYEDEEGVMVTETIEVSDVLNNLVASIVSIDDNPTLNINVPDYYESLYVVRNELGVYSSQIIPIVKNKAAVSMSSTNFKASAKDPDDVLYGVNSSQDLITINPETGEAVVISKFPSGSGGAINCAIDPINNLLYTIGRSSKHLYAFDLIEESWTDIGNTKLKGDRLTYNRTDGLLYFSVSKYLKTVDPSNGNVLSTYKINGLDNTSLGDIAFDSEGNLFMTAKKGLYRCEITNSNTCQVTKINQDNLPFYPSAMTFDSNDVLWVGYNSSNKGQLVVMDKESGEWEYRFDRLDVKLDDLASVPVEEEVVEVDTDGDGIIDLYDDYPNDNKKAYNVYTPSANGYGSYAFEDLWPNLGDFDFNDLVLHYRYKHIMNAAGLIAQTTMEFKIANVGGSFKNGFGIQINTDESAIQEVTGYKLTENLIALNGKGLENNQTKPVIIVFDNAWSNINDNNGKINIVINYTVPIRNNQMGSLNPFIFINGERGREVHLVDMVPTDLMDTSYFGTADDDSNPAIGRYYRNQTNLPWAVTMLTEFKFPKEKIAINKGYTKFASWSISSGTDYNDWYKDQSNYRNNSYLSD
ncbi:MAG: LruC domain-containing protein [Bacteroidales bacterium]|nr:LruC domain-containing protein [Bacteroidales bacterium]